MTSRIHLLLATCAALASSSCARPAKSLIGDGCYYEGSRAALKVAGDRATLLIPGEVREIGVKRQGNHASIYPGFYLAGIETPAEHSVMDRPARTVQVALEGQGDATALLIPIEGAGETPWRRGKPC